jgi:hypothetical protein
LWTFIPLICRMMVEESWSFRIVNYIIGYYGVFSFLLRFYWMVPLRLPPYAACYRSMVAVCSLIAFNISVWNNVHTSEFFEIIPEKIWMNLKAGGKTLYKNKTCSPLCPDKRDATLL